MIALHVLVLLASGAIGWLCARIERGRGWPPAPALLLVPIQIVVHWPWGRQDLASAAAFVIAYYLFGDHGRRWGRKAKQWARAQLTAVQEATGRRERALAR